MKKNLITYLLIALTVIVSSSCKKETTSAQATVNFSPLTAGNSWTYKFTEGTSAPKTYKLTATSRDTMANGKTFKVLTNSDGSTAYLGKIGNDYYRYASFPAIGVNNFEELYLKDNKAVNETWAGTATFKFGGADVTANLNYTVKGKGESRTVNGTAFNKVTKIRLDITFFGSAVGGGDFYYQDGVGLIEDNILVTPPFGSPYTSKEEITSYDIK